MLAVLSPPDAMLLAALVAACGAYLHDRRTLKREAAAATADRSAAAEAAAAIAKEFTNNGGTTARDAIDRIEEAVKELATAVSTVAEKVDVEVVPRLDHGASVLASHADRIAVLEARPPTARTRSTDTPTPRPKIRKATS